MCSSSAQQFVASMPEMIGSDGVSGAMRGRLPQLNFPVFEGENPKLWIRLSQDYFDMYSVDPSLWIKVATMHLKGPAARWFSSRAEQCRASTWPVFCQSLLDRFGKDEHEAFIRSLFRIRQTSTVSEYVERFSALVDNLVAYGRPMDPIYFVQRFVDGLREDIRAVVFVQRPSSLDSACVFALLQEEVSTSHRHVDGRRLELFLPERSLASNPLPLPRPLVTEKRNVPTIEGRRTELHRHSTGEDKLAALRAYRRARGLCQRCAEKWSRDHQCPQSVQLHVLQEVLDLYVDDAEGSSVSTVADQVAGDQVFMMLSAAAVSGEEAFLTVKFQGVIQGFEVLVLVDSGSSHSFLSSALATKLSGISLMPSSVQVQVADGARLNLFSAIDRR